MWDLILSVPDHCLSFYFSHDVAHIIQFQIYIILTAEC